jgi:hypothetical protein
MPNPKFQFIADQKFLVMNAIFKTVFFGLQNHKNNDDNILKAFFIKAQFFQNFL